MTKKKPAPVDAAKIRDEVVAEIRGDLKEHISNLREDLRADIAERPAPQQPNTEALSGIVDALKGGNIDLSKIAQLAGGAAGAPKTDAKGSPIDMAKLTPGQIEFMKMENSNRLMMTVLPLLLGPGGGQNEVLSQMMNRIFLEKINSSIFMDKIMIQKMASGLGVNASAPETGLFTPVSNMISGGDKSAVGG